MVAILRSSLSILQYPVVELSAETEVGVVSLFGFVCVSLCFDQSSFSHSNSSLEGATELKFVAFCSS